MSAIVWEVVQKTSAQVREETRKVTREETQREDAANLLALGVDISIIAQAFGLSEEEIRNLVAHSKP